ncbi:hypothetical protein ACFQ2B_32980 [Streptomyces stramineus]|uniref:Terpene synthase n=1 Tax=Streptomyces stramineus TaxID=173861 RepID=A0ABN1B652_9ACTN
MPQDFEVDIPFPPRISPDVPGARQRNVDRLVSEGLLTREESVARYLGWDVAQLAGRFHPSATGDDLDLGLQQQTFYFVFDDLFDTCLGEEPARAYALCHQMAALARHDGTARPAFPLAEMFVDVWNRSKQGMSDAWRRRAGFNWEHFFLSYVTEAVNRMCRTVLDLASYIRQRQVAIGSRGVLDLVERLSRAEAPPELHESSCFQHMRDVTADVVTLTNDVASLEKDEANQEANNAVLLLCLERGVSRQKAIGAVQHMISERVAHFHVLSAESMRMCGLLGLSPEQRHAVERFIDGNRAVMRGNYDWSRNNERYSEEGVERVRASPCIEDRLTRTPAGPHRPAAHVRHHAGSTEPGATPDALPPPSAHAPCHPGPLGAAAAAA